MSTQHTKAINPVKTHGKVARRNAEISIDSVKQITEKPTFKTQKITEKKEKKVSSRVIVTVFQTPNYALVLSDSTGYLHSRHDPKLISAAILSKNNCLDALQLPVATRLTSQ